MTDIKAKFTRGSVVHHKLFDYRGVVVDVDPHFLGTEDWYQQVAHSRPPKDTPWYHVLMDEDGHRTYVAERNLEADASGRPVRHPEISLHFDGLGAKGYIPRQRGH